MKTAGSKSYCVIGAGAAGLAAIKNLKERDILVTAFEREDEIGGNWNFGKQYSSIYKSVHLITSKRFTEYPDFPLPESYPTYINQAQALEYLRSYARAFGLYDNIEFNRTIQRVEPAADGAWNVTLENGECRNFAGVVIANGHLWDARTPQYPGHFAGVSVHSSNYKTPDLIAGKRALVVGAGNSGCDIAVESCHHAARTFHSTRRGYHYWPKYMFGMPSDEAAEMPLKLHMPLWMRRFFGKMILPMVTTGSPKLYGLPEPDHKLFASHYIVNSTLFYHLGHGDITPKPDVQELRNDRVLFSDGTEEEIDVIVYATGFNLNFPFIDKAYLNWRDGKPDFYLNIFHRERPNLFIIGLFQTSTGNWPLFHYQSQLLASYISAQSEAPSRARWLQRKMKSGQPDINAGIRFLPSSRHLLECEHFAYRSILKRHTRKLGVPPPTSLGSKSAVSRIPTIYSAVAQPRAGDAKFLSRD